jgi:type VI secretion system protein ImpH
MSREKWRAVRDLIRELSSGRRPTEFFQLVRLIETARCSREMSPPGAELKQRAGKTPRLIDEATRFRAAAAAHFLAESTLPCPDGTLFDDQGPSLIETTFMSAAGAQGVLPSHYTSLILQRLRDGDTALKDFLDLFHHRLITALVRAWEKHRPYVSITETNVSTPMLGDTDATRDAFTQFVQAVTNRKRFDIPTGYDENILLYYSGVFSERRRSAGALAAVLEDYFNVHIRITEFHPVRTQLRLEHRWRLAGGQAHGQRGPKLGEGLLLGESVQIVQTSFLVQIGPLDLREFQAYLPQGVRFPPLNQLIRHYAGFEFVFVVQLLLKAREAREFRLGDAAGTGVRLGWETWLLGRTADNDVLDDVRFVVAT